MNRSPSYLTTVLVENIASNHFLKNRVSTATQRGKRTTRVLKGDFGVCVGGEERADAETLSISRSYSATPKSIAMMTATHDGPTALPSSFPLRAPSPPSVAASVALPNQPLVRFLLPDAFREVLPLGGRGEPDGRGRADGRTV